MQWDKDEDEDEELTFLMRKVVAPPPPDQTMTVVDYDVLMVLVVKGRLTDVINLDLGKAFDSVPHNPLSKLEMWIGWMYHLENKELAAWPHFQVYEAMTLCPSEDQ
ncbi:hypothetical protein DUI87_07941 [Hirundo rustica rustica]|uniref:Reverse transcriptase domain-containing protein n=1 Tax=Hirundo rustica rustica TaxID=333673 RepID=A0A3M0L915_HIRRU|nr:hypothetical protein DUI87_07941 [Hirundo rustica rustica]